MNAQVSHDQGEQVAAWIVEQVRAGQPVPALLQSMCEQGWDRDIAIRAIEYSLEAQLALASADVDPELSASPVPEPPTSPIAINLGDCVVSVLMAMRSPRIVLYSDFLSEEECEALADAAAPRMQRSLTADMKTGGEKLDDVRTSEGMFFSRGESALIAAIESRIARLLDWPVEKGEGLQVLHYGPGKEYEPHHDYFDPVEPGTPAIIARGGQRVATLLIYLREPQCGGETVFPEHGLSFAPRRGCALFFSYDRPHASTMTLHGGAPVVSGEKWIATKWLREHVFE